MPMKDWLQRFQPLQLYIILALSICYFLIQLFLSHITHALTLLVDSYHMLCNIIALSGCILTIKHSKKPTNLGNENTVVTTKQETKEEARFVEVCIDQNPPIVHHIHEFKLRNTFGWTRIDILTMLIVCIFMASLSFSLLVEALQTLVHIEHQDAMHLPIPVFILGAAGLVLNGLCYLLIGGYTFHQGSFLHITSSGDVVLDRIVSGETLKPKERRLSKTKRDQLQQVNEFQNLGKRQGFVETFRDVCSTLFVMVCSVIVYFADDEDVTKYIDPVISICSCILLLVLSYPYMKESCLILLQTIPNSIDIEHFKKTLLTTFTDIVSVHDLHIWQLTKSKYVSTVHIIFQNPRVYTRLMDDIVNFFHEQGITIVTIQPEFKTTKLPISGTCLVRCQDAACADKHCCMMIHESKEDKKVKKKNVKTISENIDKNGSSNGIVKSKSTNNLNLGTILEINKKFSSEPKLTTQNSSSTNLDPDPETKKTETNDIKDVPS